MMRIECQGRGCARPWHSYSRLFSSAFPSEKESGSAAGKDNGYGDQPEQGTAAAPVRRAGIVRLIRGNRLIRLVRSVTIVRRVRCFGVILFFRVVRCF
jgi:hypothetical protein